MRHKRKKKRRKEKKAETFEENRYSICYLLLRSLFSKEDKLKTKARKLFQGYDFSRTGKKKFDENRAEPHSPATYNFHFSNVFVIFNYSLT